MKLKHIFIFECQELTAESFKCAVRVWKSRREIKWKWFKRRAEWKHLKTWHQACPWVTAAIRAEEEHPLWEHRSDTSELNQAWIIQTFSPIFLSAHHRPHLLRDALTPVRRLTPLCSSGVRLSLEGCRVRANRRGGGGGTYLLPEVGRGRSGTINGCGRRIWAAAGGLLRKRVMKGCSEQWEIGADEGINSPIGFQQGHVWRAEEKQRRTGGKRERKRPGWKDPNDERIEREQGNRSEDRRRWDREGGGSDSNRLPVSSLTRAESGSSSSWNSWRPQISPRSFLPNNVRHFQLYF